MKRKLAASSHGIQLAKITTELEQLVQQQSEMTRREALVGLTPAELGAYEQLGERIRQLFVEMARLNSCCHG